MRAWMIPILCVLLAASVSALAQDERPPMDLPVYPGSEITMEIDLSAEDIAPMLQAMLPMMSAGKPEAPKLSPEDIADMLQNIKRIEFLQTEVSKSKITVQQIADYYAANVPGGRWSRVFYNSTDNATIAVYADPESESYYGFRVRNATVDGRQEKRVDAAKIVGKIDLIRLMKTAVKWAMPSAPAEVPSETPPLAP